MFLSGCLCLPVPVCLFLFVCFCLCVSVCLCLSVWFLSVLFLSVLLLSVLFLSFVFLYALFLCVCVFCLVASVCLCLFVGFCLYVLYVLSFCLCLSVSVCLVSVCLVSVCIVSVCLCRCLSVSVCLVSVCLVSVGSVPVCLFLSGSFCVRLAALRRAPRLRCALRIFDTVRHLALRRMCVAAVVRGGGGGGGGGVSEDYVLQVSRPEKAKQIVFCFEGECIMGGRKIICGCFAARRGHKIVVALGESASCFVLRTPVQHFLHYRVASAHLRAQLRAKLVSAVALRIASIIRAF